MAGTLLNHLKSIVNQIDDCGPCCPCPCPAPSPPPSGSGCPPCPFPYAQICMLTPPICPAPTEPKYVKPLQLPSSAPSPRPSAKRDPEADFRSRISNFYNNYNVDYHSQGPKGDARRAPGAKQKCGAVTVDGKRPRCEDYTKRKEEEAQRSSRGCPTGFRPCTVKLRPPEGCDPLGVWRAVVQPCPPKPKKSVSNRYRPGECKRPCCKHWRPKDGPCLYDGPCRAHCYDHPPGIKPLLNV